MNNPWKQIGLLPGIKKSYGKIAKMANKSNSKKTSKNRYSLRFGKLHWKLTITYTGVTLAALILLEAVVLFGGLMFLNWFFKGPLLPSAIENTFGNQLVSSIQTHIQNGPSDFTIIQDILMNQVGDVGFSNNTDTQLIVVDNFSSSIASVGFGLVDPLENISDDQILIRMKEVISEIIDTNSQKSIHAYVEDSLVIGMPIFNEEDPKTLIGVLGMVTAVPSIDFDFIRRLLPMILISLGIFSLGVAGIGTIFGYFTSKGLVSRIQGLSKATQQWQKGNFNEVVRDEHLDELADLGNQMNNMASQLNGLIYKRKLLAVAEERNRIARDLHDSVKQKAYAAAGQINGAMAILSSNPEKASGYLRQADDLIHDIRYELTLLINELRPIELQEKSFFEAVEGYLESWSRRNEIEIKFVTGDQLELDEDTETAVFRLIQEATSNIARHSQAEHAVVHISLHDSTIEVVISDDGMGFQEESDSRGFGLDSIKERFESNQIGSVEITSKPGEGTTIRVLLNKSEEDDG